jgi:hypothetical protein
MADGAEQITEPEERVVAVAQRVENANGIGLLIARFDSPRRREDHEVMSFEVRSVMNVYGSLLFIACASNIGK